MLRAVKLGGVASGDRMEPSAVAINTQQATYAIPDRIQKASDITMVTGVLSEGWVARGYGRCNNYAMRPLVMS